MSWLELAWGEASESTTASWALLLCCGSGCCKEVVDGSRLDWLGWLGWLGWLHTGWSQLLSSCWSPDRAAAAFVGPIAEVGALAAALVSALVVERSLFVDAAAPFCFVLGNVVPLVCVHSCPGKRKPNANKTQHRTQTKKTRISVQHDPLALRFASSRPFIDYGRYKVVFFFS